MKKLFLTTGTLMVIMVTATYAQNNIDDDNADDVRSTITKTMNEIQKEGAETNQHAVSPITISQFASDFPDVTNIHFEKTKDYDEVTYTQNGRNNTAYYNANSELIGTIVNRSFSNLPLEAQKTILHRYPNYSIVKVLRFNVNGDNASYFDNSGYLTLYGNSFDASSNYFVELKNDNKSIVLEVDLSGEVSFFTAI